MPVSGCTELIWTSWSRPMPLLWRWCHGGQHDGYRYNNRAQSTLHIGIFAHLKLSAYIIITTAEKTLTVLWFLYSSTRLTVLSYVRVAETKCRSCTRLQPEQFSWHRMRDIYTISIYGKRNLVCFNRVLSTTAHEELDLLQNSSRLSSIAR